MIRRVIAFVVLAMVVTPSMGDAHLMPEGQGSTRIVGNKAYTLVSVPVAVLHGFDDDRNSAISDAEAHAHSDTIQAQIEQRLQLYDDRNVAGRTIYKDLQVPHFDSASTVQSAAVIQIRVSEWDAPPKSLRLHADIFTLKTQQLYFRAIMGDSTETATLSRNHKEAGFFGAQIAPVEPPSLLRPGLTLAALLSIALALMSARTRGGLGPRRLLVSPDAPTSSTRS